MMDGEVLDDLDGELSEDPLIFFFLVLVVTGLHWMLNFTGLMVHRTVPRNVCSTGRESLEKVNLLQIDLERMLVYGGDALRREAKMESPRAVSL